MKQSIRIGNTKYTLNFMVRNYKAFEVDDFAKIIKDTIESTSSLEEAKEKINSNFSNVFVNSISQEAVIRKTTEELIKEHLGDNQ